MLSLPADFKTNGYRLLMAHGFRPLNEAQDTQLHFYDGPQLAREWVHRARYRLVEAFKQGNCCAAQAFNYNIIHDFSVAAQFHVLIPAAMSV